MEIEESIIKKKTKIHVEIEGNIDRITYIIPPERIIKYSLRCSPCINIQFSNDNKKVGDSTKQFLRELELKLIFGYR